MLNGPANNDLNNYLKWLFVNNLINCTEYRIFKLRNKLFDNLNIKGIPIEKVSSIKYLRNGVNEN